MPLTSLGEAEQSPTMVDVEVRTAPLGAEPWVLLFGLINGGFEVMQLAWPKLDHVFSDRRSNGDGRGEASPEPSKTFRELHRLPNNLLNDFPVDLLTIEQGFATKAPVNFERQLWKYLISRTEVKN
jgi:hypothetical protein